MTKSLGEVFRSAWNVAKKNFVALFVPTVIFVGILFLLYGIDAVGGIANSMRMEQMGYMQQGTPVWITLATVGVSVFLTPLYSGFITAVLRFTHITGQPTPMRAAWDAACANYLKYLLTILTQILFNFVFAIVIAIIAVAVFFASVFPSVMSWTMHTPDAWEGLAMIVSAMIPMLIVIAVLGWVYQFSQMFVTFIPGMEQKQGFKAFFDSFRYIYQGNFWKNLGHILLAGVIRVLIMGLIAVIFFLPFFMNVGLHFDSFTTAEQILSPLLWGLPLFMLVGGFVSVLFNVLFMPYYFEVYLNAKAEVNRKDAAKGAVIPQHMPYRG